MGSWDTATPMSARNRMRCMRFSRPTSAPWSAARSTRSRSAMSGRKYTVGAGARLATQTHCDCSRTLSAVLRMLLDHPAVLYFGKGCSARTL